MRKGAAAGTALGLLAVGALSGCGIVGIAGLIDTEIRKEVKVSALMTEATGPGTISAGPGSVGALTSDLLISQQWALDNDGSFFMEEQQNRYPVYDDPFGMPSAPGAWMLPPEFGRPGGGRRMIGMHRFSGSGLLADSSAGQAAGSTAGQMTGPPAGETVGQAAGQVTAAAGIDINVSQAWELYDGGSRDVIVAIVDTGIDYRHEDLAEAIWVNADEIPGNGVDDDGNGYVDDVNGWNFYNNNNQVYTGSEDSHGTHGAGTIAARADNGTGIAGIVQSGHVKIMPVKALGGPEGSGNTVSIIQAIRYAEANGASICNLSLGSEVDDRAFYEAIASSNMLFVVAAGNDGEDTDRSPCYPASYDLDNIISVANLNYDGSLHYGSNYGVVSVDLAAPGSYILSATPENGYSYMTGTSMAAPMVTAAAAMVYSYDSEITLPEVKEILLASARPLDSLAGVTATGGMLDLGAAMALAAGK